LFWEKKHYVSRRQKGRGVKKREKETGFPQCLGGREEKEEEIDRAGLKDESSLAEGEAKKRIFTLIISRRSRRGREETTQEFEKEKEAANCSVRGGKKKITGLAEGNSMGTRRK